MTAVMRVLWCNDPGHPKGEHDHVRATSVVVRHAGQPSMSALLDVVEAARTCVEAHTDRLPEGRALRALAAALARVDGAG